MRSYQLSEQKTKKNTRNQYNSTEDIQVYNGYIYFFFL